MAGEPYFWRGLRGGAGLLERRKRELAGMPTVVSAIVPLFRSERYAERCLRSLREHLPVGSEIIAVDDASRDRSGAIAERILAHDPDSLVLRHSRNLGFGPAVNAGAKLSRGLYLLPFNADAFASAGFLEPMIRTMEAEPRCAIVGNRHFRPKRRLDSEGSEFCWQRRNFEHVGRDIADPFAGDGVKERDMVTFACVLIRRGVWDELGGIDEEYRKAYFEDGDFCLRARAKGHRVFYTPDSEIVHVGNHTNVGSGPDQHANAELFASRWVRTGLVDRFRRERGIAAHDGRIVVCMIACSEEEFVAASIESVYPLADRIVVVEGGTRFAAGTGLCGAKGRSTDRTVEEIDSVPDPDGKIELVRSPGRAWRDKNEMRDRYVAELRPGDWMLLLDADEVFSAAGLWRLSAIMHDADVIRPAFHLVWNDMNTLGTGKWAQYRQVKAVRWREGFTYARDHNMPSDRRGVKATHVVGSRLIQPGEPLYWHYSWAGKTDAKLRAKAAYYVQQNGADVFPPDWFDRVFLAWRRDRAGVERRYGTHPYGGGGTQQITAPHPAPVRRRMKEGKIR